MDYKTKKKTSKDIDKIRARFKAKYDEYVKLSSIQLKEIFDTQKLSSTDTEALIQACDVVLKQEGIKKLEEEKKLKELETKTEETNDNK